VLRLRRKRVVLLLLVVLVLSAGVGAGLYLAACRVPTFYRQRIETDPAAEKQAHEKMFRQVTTLGNDVRHSGAWQATFSEQDINGWLAFDLTQNFPKTLPANMHDPRVMIRPDGITLACRADWNRVHTVLTLKVDVSTPDPHVLALRIRQVRVGALPWPMSRVLQSIADAARKLGLRIQWKQAGGDPVALVTISAPRSDHDDDVEIDALKLGEGEIHIDGATRRK
jgi:hypothetical protein